MNKEDKDVQNDAHVQNDERNGTQEQECKCEEYKAGWARAQADYQNLQKEVEQKRSEWVKMSEVQILEEFIPVYDNFKKAFASEQAEVGEQNGWAKGIEHIMKQFGDILKRYNVQEIKTVGEQFDPALHEAMGEEQSEEHSEGIIVREIDSGYTANGNVIKVAKVIVCVS